MALLVVMGVLLKLGTKHIENVTFRWQESGCASALPDTAHVSLHCSAESCPPADEAGWSGATLSALTPLMQEYAQLKTMNSELKRVGYYFSPIFLVYFSLFFWFLVLRGSDRRRERKKERQTEGK